MDKFILPARKRNLPKEETPKIRISPKAFEILSEMSFDSGMPMSKIASGAIEFAFENLQYNYKEQENE